MWKTLHVRVRSIGQFTTGHPQGAQIIQGVIAVSNSWDVHTALCIASPLLSTQVPGKLTASRDGVLGRWGPHENQLSLE